jgi:hypothetical protein
MSQALGTTSTLRTNASRSGLSSSLAAPSGPAILFRTSSPQQHQRIASTYCGVCPRPVSSGDPFARDETPLTDSNSRTKGSGNDDKERKIQSVSERPGPTFGCSGRASLISILQKRRAKCLPMKPAAEPSVGQHIHEQRVRRSDGSRWDVM